MAVDTKNKRFTIMGLHQPVPLLLPDPDGAVSAVDRLQYLGVYASYLVSQIGRLTGKLVVRSAMAGQFQTRE